MQIIHWNFKLWIFGDAFSSGPILAFTMISSRAGGDSLLATQMLLEVEAAVGGRVPQSALAEASTIRQLASIATAGIDDEELVTIAKDGVGTPFFFCHGDFVTRGFYALKLAALLESTQPVYLIQPLFAVDDGSNLIIEDMARPHVPRLLELQPHGESSDSAAIAMAAY